MHFETVVLRLAAMVVGSPRQHSIAGRLEAPRASEKHSLASILRDHGPLSLTDAVDIALDICDALASAHASGVVHGDLGLHRVRTAWPRVAGSAVDIFALGEDDSAAFAFRSSGFGLLVAPEQRDGLLVDVRADVWAVGAMLYLMLVGAQPGASRASARQGLAHAPRAVVACIEACLSEDPARRPESVDAIAESLGSFGSAAPERFERLVRRRAARESAKHVRKELTELDRVLTRLDDAALERELAAVSESGGPRGSALERLASVVRRSTGGLESATPAPIVDDDSDAVTVIADRRLSPTIPRAQPPREAVTRPSLVDHAERRSIVSILPVALPTPPLARPAMPSFEPLRSAARRASVWTTAFGAIGAAAAIALGVGIGVRLMDRAQRPTAAAQAPRAADAVTAPARSVGPVAPAVPVVSTVPSVVTPSSLPDAPALLGAPMTHERAPEAEADPGGPKRGEIPSVSTVRAAPGTVEVASPHLLSDAP